tara:strand:+ start:766 stop:1434 length:669 start_codon:yes stop_codon:yes gene_type:complete
MKMKGFLDTSNYEICRVLEDNYLNILDEYHKFNFQDDVNILQRIFYDENYKFWKYGYEASLEMAKMKDDGVDYDTANFGVYKKSHSWYGMHVNDLSIWEFVLLGAKVSKNRFGPLEKMKPTPICKKFFNNTFNLLNRYSEVISVIVAKFPPGRTIPLHRGDRKIRRFHLGLVVPEGDIAFQVRGEKKKWEEGKCLGFNDFYEHTAWNNTDEDRINLIVDVKR